MSVPACRKGEPCTKPEHKGHKRYVGGLMDGQVNGLLYAREHLDEYPQQLGTVAREGQRNWYQLDHAASSVTDVVYRYAGIGREFPALD